MATVKPSMVEQVLALHRRHYGDEFAVRASIWCRACSSC
jgi:hypothetical protein